LFYENIVFSNWKSLGFLSIYIFLVLFIKNSVSFLVGCIPFWTTEYAGVLKLFSGIYTFFSGMAVPLYLVNRMMIYNPLAFTS